jgi:hypothetical protein
MSGKTKQIAEQEFRKKLKQISENQANSKNMPINPVFSTDPLKDYEYALSDLKNNCKRSTVL